MADEIVEKETIVVHTNEGHSWQWNPITHDMTTVELNDGNMMTHVRPKKDTSVEVGG